MKNHIKIHIIMLIVCAIVFVIAALGFFANDGTANVSMADVGLIERADGAA